MRCLFLAPFVPFPPVDGGRMRMFAILTWLAQRHTVDILTLAEGDESPSRVDALRGLGFDVEAIPHGRPRHVVLVRALASGRAMYTEMFRSPRFAQALRARLARYTYSVIQCEYAYMAQYRDTERDSPPWILDAHNVEFRITERLAGALAGKGIAYRAYARREIRRRQRDEVDACRRVDHVLAVSAIDRDALCGAGVDTPVSVVPNGIDVDHYTPNNSRSPTPGAVFVGKMDYRPNVDAVVAFCRDTLPLVRRDVPDFLFTIVGSNPTGEVRSLGELAGVRVTGTVADPRPYLRDAWLSVVPLRAGSGTRLKILEALAMERVVVATTVACEGLDLRHDEGVVVVDDPASIAARVVELVRSPARRSELGARGRRAVQQRYAWGTVLPPLEAIYQTLGTTGSRPAARPAAGRVSASAAEARMSADQ